MMEHDTTPVKTTRRYDTTKRRQRAQDTRDGVIDAATTAFLRDGFAATTVASIAETAHVSVETIYKSFGGKAGLVRAIWQRGLAGAGPIPAERRSDEMQRRESDPRKVLERWGTFTAEVAPRVAPILLLIREAAGTDAEMAALLRESDEARLSRMELNARRLLDGGGLPEGVTLNEVRDVLWLFSSPELYDLLVVRRGWSLQRYGHFVSTGIEAALLGVDAPPRS
jgi:AcrR family transcriptional regulator